MKYDVQNFKNGTALTANHLNHIESGISTLFDIGNNSIKYDSDLKLVLFYMDDTLIGTLSYDEIKSKRCNIIFIGNSYSQNTSSYLYDFFTALGVEEFCIDVMYIGGCSIDTHWTNAQNDSASYDLWEYTGSGTTKTTNGVKLSTALKAKEYDWVIFSQNSDNSGIASSYANLQNLIDYVKNNIVSADTKYAFNMTWAWKTGRSSYDTVYGDPTTMYNQVVACMKSEVLPKSDISCLIPNGTAVHIARQPSVIGEAKLFADTTHLSVHGSFMIGMVTVFSLLKGYPHYYDIKNYTPDFCLPTNKHPSWGTNTGTLDTSYANQYYVTASKALTSPLEPILN